ncbi:hypothetical protein BU14_0285s0013 [Porphyra umbilicalis]|uniref:S-adenosylmethionine-dependent methyltransferase domain-containing protein n=1 Tax=Porphyra umbilicalis TaxID=2786 RepID=A0A1X6P187_PORUM|nr:hypothetical protein BU14_0285s0013 [Porphyra umbilicalis]|eukprot:OSX74525.1 hypothetical protein BU14_0285s0013 [Porphyra umbilicalis]
MSSLPLRSAAAFLPPPTPLLATLRRCAWRPVAAPTPAAAAATLTTATGSRRSSPSAALRVYPSTRRGSGGGDDGGGGRFTGDGGGDGGSGPGRSSRGGRGGGGAGAPWRGRGGAVGGGGARAARRAGMSPFFEDALPPSARRDGGTESFQDGGGYGGDRAPAGVAPRGGRRDAPARGRGGGGDARGGRRSGAPPARSGGGGGSGGRGGERDAPPSPAEVAEATATAAVSADVAAFAAAGLPAVVLRRGKARLFRDGGSPLVFGGAVASLVAGDGVDVGAVAAGSPVGVVDGAGGAIGFGVYNPDSLYRVAARLAAAAALRARLRLPRADTTAYRLVNGEGDRLSGLAVDVYGRVAVVSSSAAWVEAHRALITDALVAVLPRGVAVVWRRSADRLRQDGWVPPPAPADSVGSDADAESVAHGDDAGADGGGGSAEAEVLEGGLSFTVSLRRGQKTGFYVDQRENRAAVGGVLPPPPPPAGGGRVGGGRVLDAFCYSGGFGVHALAAGASEVTFVDSSGAALALARRNVAANFPGAAVATATVSTTAGLVADDAAAAASPTDGGGGGATTATFVTGDAVAALDALAAGSAANAAGFDVAIVDPPKLAPTAAVLDRAARKYGRINGAALRTLAPAGGVLISCTCSAAMSADRGRFVETVRAAGRGAGRELTLLRTSGAAADHPVDPASPQGSYLTVCWFAVGPAAAVGGGGGWVGWMGVGKMHRAALRGGRCGLGGGRDACVSDASCRVRADGAAARSATPRRRGCYFMPPPGAVCAPRTRAPSAAPWPSSLARRFLGDAPRTT